MPAVREYIVTQTREVKVTAENPSDAVAMGNELFKTVDSGDQTVAYAGRDLRVTEMSARESF